MDAFDGRGKCAKLNHDCRGQKHLGRCKVVVSDVAEAMTMVCVLLLPDAFDLIVVRFTPSL